MRRSLEQIREDFGVTPLFLMRGGWAYNQTLSAREIPWTADAPYFLVFHDRDLAMDVGSVAGLLAGLGTAIQYMTANEYCAYLHAAVTGDARALTLEYDDHYCRYFASHASSWTLHRSGAAPETQTVEIPKGLGRHVVRVAP